VRPDVLFVVGADRFAGAEESLRILISALPVELAITVAGPNRAIVEQIAAVRTSAEVRTITEVSTKHHLSRVVTLGRELRRIDARLVHLNKADVGDLRYVEALLALLRTPVVSVVHHVEPPKPGPGEWLSCRLAHRARNVVAVSGRSGRELESLLGLDDNTVSVIPNALPALDRTSSAVLGDETFTIGVLARLVSHKAVDRVITAVAALPRARLLIGGDGPTRVELEQLVDRLDLTDRVDFLGWVDPAAVLDRSQLVMSAATIEGHPMALLDAQRRGIPVVAADVGGVPDIVENGVTGLLVPADDVTALARAARRLMVDLELRQSMSRAARERSLRRDPAMTAADYLDLYNLRSPTSRDDQVIECL